MTNRVTLPSTLKSIGPDAFGSCKNLRRIVIPESVVEIGNGACSSCISLSEIVLPKGLTMLGYNALRRTAIRMDAPLTEEEQMMQAALRELKKNGMLQ